MAQTTQIVPKFSFPNVETHINDYTQVADDTTTVAGDTSVTQAYAVISSKGIDNKWVRKASRSDAVKMFGESNFKKYGQPLMQALNVLNQDNTVVWFMRVMPENAAYANAVVSAFYKADTAEDAADASKRKFRIKLVAKSFENVTSDDILKEKFKEFNGAATKLPNGTSAYKDGAGYTQKQILAARYTGRGSCGNLFSLRLAQALNYEKEYGIKFYNFDVLNSETSLTKDAQYTGALISSVKYGAETATLIDDILSDVEPGIVPVNVMTNEENVNDVYDAYIEFATKLHADLEKEYETKVKEYAIPEEMMNGTVALDDKYVDKYNELIHINDLIVETEKDNLPDNDEFDIIFGNKVASTEKLPAVQIIKELTSLVDVTAKDYDSKDYATADSGTVIVDFTSAHGLELVNGHNGYFDDPRTEVVNGESKKWTVQEEVADALCNAYNGKFDKKILSPRRIPVTSFFDANYPMSVKKTIVDLAESRNDCRVWLDTGIIDSLSDSSLNSLFNQYSIFDSRMVSIDIHNYLVKESSTNKKCRVTISYYLSATYANHLNQRSFYIPLVFSNAELTGHVRDSMVPVIEEYDTAVKEKLYEHRFNYFECIGENRFWRATQSTTQKTQTDLMEENNAATLYELKRLIERDSYSQLYNFTDADIRNDFIAVEKAKYAGWAGTAVQDFNISFKTTKYEFDHSILHCYIDVTFRGLTKSIIIEIDINKRQYQQLSTDVIA